MLKKEEQRGLAFSPESHSTDTAQRRTGRWGSSQKCHWCLETSQAGMKQVLELVRAMKDGVEWWDNCGTLLEELAQMIMAAYPGQHPEMASWHMSPELEGLLSPRDRGCEIVGYQVCSPGRVPATFSLGNMSFAMATQHSQ